MTIASLTASIEVAPFFTTNPHEADAPSRDASPAT